MGLTRKDVIKAFALALIVTPVSLGIFAACCWGCYGLWVLTNG